MRLFRVLVLETLGACNRTCVSCHRQTLRASDGSLPLLRTVETKIGRGDKMPTELFERLIDEAAELGFHGRLWMQYYSEPLLDERLPDLARYARQKLSKTRITITTNADLMTPEIAKELNGVLDELQISLYMSPKRQKERKVQLRKWLPKPRLVFTPGTHFLARKVNSPGMEDAIASVIDTPCTRENDYMAIAYNGDVCHCCFDPNAEFGLGNVNDSSLRELWYSQTNRQIMATLSKKGGRRNYDPCQQCPRPNNRAAARPTIEVVPLRGHER